MSVVITPNKKENTKKTKKTYVEKKTIKKEKYLIKVPSDKKREKTTLPMISKREKVKYNTKVVKYLNGY